MLLGHPGVKDACVMGLPSLLDGEHPMAFVVKAKKSLDAKELQDFVAGEAAGFEFAKGKPRLEFGLKNQV